MPAKQFICPDGCNIEINDCFKQCRLSDVLIGKRCLSLRTLRAIAEQRGWSGIPSTTQLLKGTREAYLEIITDYAIDPQEALFRVHGSKAHAFLDQFIGEDELGEERLHSDFCSGQFDYYDPETEALYDTKTWGAYKVQKALGMFQVDMETGELYKTGERKGQPKTRKEWRYGGVREILNEAIQLNDYRMKLEKVLPNGYRVKQMLIEALVRDGGAITASMRGVEQKGVLIPVNKISDHWIKKYLTTKSMRLITALETDVMPNKCNSRESWQGRKCEKYCNVREVCQKYEEQRSVDSEYLQEVI